MQINDQIFVTSINKLINKAKVSGKFNVNNINVLTLFKAFNYYLNNPQILSEIYPIDYNDKIRYIKESLQFLEYQYPEAICNYKIVLTTKTNSDYIDIEENTAPTVSGKAITFDTNIYNFNISDFTTNYFDAQNDGWKNIKVYPEADNGKLLYNGVEVIQGQEIPVSNIGNLTFVRVNFGAIFTEDIHFKISDDNPVSLYSEEATIEMNAIVLENEPPNIGDISLTAPNLAITVLDLSVFTTQMSPPYNDPENDAIDAIRIDLIGSANKGVFEYKGVPVTVGTIIPREDLNANLFIHKGPNVTSISTDIMEFSARDEGSKHWVQ